ncbi:hypothetical protein V6R86_01525 [Sphingomonas kaistensis]|uniref:Uncharacterized protein n=1 Tax=Sphingomonas kaistensis TaxID=298708 RepID=A0ABZ2FX46_9SPHN
MTETPPPPPIRPPANTELLAPGAAYTRADIRLLFPILSSFLSIAAIQDADVIFGSVDEALGLWERSEVGLQSAEIKDRLIKEALNFDERFPESSPLRVAAWKAAGANWHAECSITQILSFLIDMPPSTEAI